MKTLLLILTVVFLGKEPVIKEVQDKMDSSLKIIHTKSKFRPTPDQIFQLYKSKIELANSGIKEDLTEVKEQLNYTD